MTDILREPLDPKQQTHQQFRGINLKITKSGRILEYFLSSTLFFPGKETVYFFFLSYSVTYNVNFTKVIHIFMPHRSNIFLNRYFFLKFHFLALFREIIKEKKILFTKMTAFLPFIPRIRYYIFYDLQI